MVTMVTVIMKTWMFMMVVMVTDIDGMVVKLKPVQVADPCQANLFETDIALGDEEFTKHSIEQSKSDYPNVKSLKSFDSIVETHVPQPESASVPRHQRHKHKKHRRQQRNRSRKQKNIKNIPDNHNIDDHAGRQKRAAIALPHRLWPHAVVPFVIEPRFNSTQKALLRRAMRHWENQTCLTFVDKTDEHDDYILFTERDCGCCSFIGRKANGGQGVSIGPHCHKFGIIVHELGHTIGFWHEHTRPDRDQNVEILHHNIQPGQEMNFNKMTYEEVDSLGEPYDLESVMHYPKTSFSRSPRLNTIQVIGESEMDLELEIGQRKRLSEGDIRQANKLYQCPACGRTFHAPSGSFSSPAVHQDNMPPAHCQWRISAAHGQRISLILSLLDIADSPNCMTDYVEIRDGYYIGSPLIGRYCGSHTLPDSIISTGNWLWIEYRTVGQYIPYQGFFAEYNTVCGGLITQNQGYISSPLYPENYGYNQLCEWTIMVPNDSLIALQFEGFQLELSDNCDKDYLEVRDGNSTSSVIGRFCGNERPDDILSATNQLFLRFVSDHLEETGGFIASFVKEEDECILGQHDCEHECVNTPGSYVCQCYEEYELSLDGKSCQKICGGTINITESQNYTIHSPNYPGLYPSDSRCVWKINAPEHVKIILEFQHIDLEGRSGNCQFDAVKVRIGSNGTASSRSQQVLCGAQIPEAIMSSTASMTVLFTSDESVQRNGFSALLYTDTNQCMTLNGGCEHYCQNTRGSYLCSCLPGYSLHDNGHNCQPISCHHDLPGAGGVITSPNWPGLYPNDQVCSWKLSALEGHRLQLVIDSMEIEEHADCLYDYIEVFDRIRFTLKRIGRYCGTQLPESILSTGNELHVTFQSDVSLQKTGFTAAYNTICGGELTATRQPQVLYSHSTFIQEYYQGYPNNQNCFWEIKTEDSEGKILLQFLEFDLEETADCEGDHVQIQNRRRMRKPDPNLLFCGGTVPATVVSPGSQLFMYFQSDSQSRLGAKGFKAKYRVVDSDSNERIGNRGNRTHTGNRGNPRQTQTIIESSVLLSPTHRQPRNPTPRRTSNQRRYKLS